VIAQGNALGPIGPMNVSPERAELGGTKANSSALVGFALSGLDIFSGLSQGNALGSVGSMNVSPERAELGGAETNSPAMLARTNSTITAHGLGVAKGVATRLIGAPGQMRDVRDTQGPWVATNLSQRMRELNMP
jgi:hypothetical protein